jgi:hypothetical protein
MSEKVCSLYQTIAGAARVDAGSSRFTTRSSLQAAYTQLDFGPHATNAKQRLPVKRRFAREFNAAAVSAGAAAPLVVTGGERARPLPDDVLLTIRHSRTHGGALGALRSGISVVVRKDGGGKEGAASVEVWNDDGFVRTLAYGEATAAASASSAVVNTGDKAAAKVKFGLPLADVWFGGSDFVDDNTAVFVANVNQADTRKAHFNVSTSSAPAAAADKNDDTAGGSNGAGDGDGDGDDGSDWSSKYKQDQVWGEAYADVRTPSIILLNITDGKYRVLNTGGEAAGWTCGQPVVVSESEIVYTEWRFVSDKLGIVVGSASALVTFISVLLCFAV